MIRRPVLATLATLGAASAGLLVGGAPAGAFVGRATVGSPFGTFTNARGITIDQSTGNVYVVDGSSAEKIRIFGPEGGAPVGGGPSEFNGSESTDGGFKVNGEPAGPAFDAKNHVFYFPDVQNNIVDKYKLEGSAYKFVCEFTSGGTSGDACGAEGASGTTKFREPLGVAVDSSGDLYIGDYGSAKIYEYSAAGVEIAAFASPGGSPQYMTVAANGTIYEQTYGSRELWEFKRSSPTGTTLEGEPTRIMGGVNGLAFDQATGDLSVSLGATVEDLNAKHEVVGGSVEGALPNYGEGLAVNEATDYLSVLNGSTGGVVTFGLGVLLPDVTTNEPSPIGRTTATLKGTVNPDGQEGTKYWFEYGSTSSGTYTTVGEKIEIPGEPNEPIVVSLPITGLTGGSGYRYRIVTENKNGTNPGAEVRFETSLAVEGMKIKPATAVSAEGATLNATLEPNGLKATCHFRYGAEFAYNKETAKEDAGEAAGETPVTAPLTGLEPNREYRYQLVCENTFGTSTSPSEGSFTTLKEGPKIVAQETANVSRQRGVLVAKVNPENEGTTYYFEYGLTSSYGYTTPETELQSAEYGEVIAQAVATELETNTEYHFRVIVKNGSGTVQGADTIFTSGHLTPPVVTTGGATRINQNGATIEGVVDTEGLVTSYGFQIGTSKDDLGPTTGQGSVGAGFNEAAVSLVLHGLQPTTTYFYRIVGTNVDSVNGSESTGEIHEFTTTAYPNPNITVDQLRVLHEPFVTWPIEVNPLFPKGETTKPAVTCKKGFVKKHGKCVKKKAKHKKSKGKKGKGKKKG